MSIHRIKTWLTVALMFFVLACGASPAAVLVYDTFADLDYKNVPNSPPDSIRWFTGVEGGTSAAGGQLVTSPAGTAQRGVIGYLDSLHTVVYGQILTLSFDYRFSTVANGDYSFIFGLFNSGGTKVTTDTTGFNNAVYSNDRGYVGAGVFGTDPSGGGRMHLHERVSGANALLHSAFAIPYNMGSAVIQTGGTLPDTTYKASLSLFNTGNSMVITMNIDGQSLTRTDTTDLVTSFDQIGIFGAGGVGTLTLDNIKLEHVSILPEPGTLLLLLSGALLLLRRRSLQRV